MLFKSTGQSLLWKAKEEAARIVQAHLDKHLQRVKTYGEVVDEFLRTENPNLKKRRESTQQNNIAFCLELKKELGELPLTQVADESFWSNWFDGFVRRKSKRSTFNDYIVRNNMLMRFAYRRRYISHLVKFDLVDPQKNVGRVLSPKEIGALFEAMSVHGKDQFVLAYENGMRLREMLHLTWDRVDFEKGTIILRPEDVKTGRKTGKGREFLASDQALERLLARKKRMGDSSPYVFPSKLNLSEPQEQNKAMWKRAKKKAGIRGRCRWHDIRHTAITHMVDKGEDITAVSIMVGTSVRTLQRVYLHSTFEKTRSVAKALRIKG